MENKHIIKKPNFFDGPYTIYFIETAITFAAYFFVDINKTIKINIKLKFLILIIAIAILFITLNIRYIRKVKEDFTNLDETIKNKDEEINRLNANRKTLVEDNDRKDSEIKQLKTLLIELSLAYDDLIREINSGLITISDSEKDFLKGLIESAYKKKEHFIRMRGNDYNE